MSRRLSGDEAALWSRVAKTVAPIQRRGDTPLAGEVVPRADRVGAASRAPPPPSRSARAAPPPKPEELRQPRSINQTLDATWDRRLARGLVQPDFTIDLHGHSLDAAHSRLDHGLTLALAQGARTVLLVTGRPRPSGITPDAASGAARSG